MLEEYSLEVEDYSPLSAFASLNWMIKILTLDHPSYLSSYRIPRSMLSECQVRRLLLSRKEFSREAALKVKINWKEDEKKVSQ